MVQFKVFRSLWGAGPLAVERRWTEVLPRIRAAGYNGVECSLLDCGKNDDERMEFREVLDQHNLDLIISCYSSWTDYEGPSPQGSADIHSEVSVFATELASASKLKPIKINAHVGSDLWPNLDDHDSLFAACLRLSEGLPVCFETHRGRPLGHPANALRLIAKFPQLRLTGDFSHWSVAVERPLSEISLAIQMAIEHCDHIHARVGTSQSPQIHDPESHQLKEYEVVWTQVWRSMLKRNPHAILTATPEYGPSPYAPLHSTQAEIDRVNDLGKSQLHNLFEREILLRD